MKSFNMPSRKKQGGWVQLAIAGVGMAASLFGGQRASEKARAAGKAQADLIIETNKENRRRREFMQTQTLGVAQAASGASNILQSGSTKLYQDQLAAEYQKELQWMDKAAKLAARAARRGASQAGDLYMQQGFQSALGYAGQYASSSEFQNWMHGTGTTS